MRMLTTTLALIGAAFVVGAAAPASAQATRTWVSGVGDDANPCSRTAPCKTFAGALPKTATNGQIDCLDPGGFGAVSITKSITIDCSTQTGGITASGANGITINGAGIVVVLEGLDIEGLGTGARGVQVSNAASVTLRDVTISGFNAPNGQGVLISTSSAVEVAIFDSVISDNGAVGSGGGIEVAPQGSGTAKVLVRGTQVVDNRNLGMRLNTTGTTQAGSSVTLDDVLIGGNAQGFVAFATSGTAASVTISDSLISNNAGAGILAAGAAASVRVGGSVISGNATGVSAAASSQIQSFSTNVLAGNVNDGAFSTPAIPGI